VTEADKAELFKAFRADHAMLGQGFHILRERGAAGAPAGARRQARRIDREAGAHIAFEEEDFYPALKRFLDGEEVAAMYRAHEDARLLIGDLAAASDAELTETDAARGLLNRIDAMQTHVSECGELFGAMGGLSPDEIKTLLQRLQDWRAAAPRWTDHALARPRPSP